MSEARTPVPVTVVSGPLGAGKTTLVEHVLRHCAARGERLAVIVNDLARLDIDAARLREAEGITGTPLADGIVELSSGCICCTRRDDLVTRIEEVVARYAPDAVLVESTGVADPLELAHAFSGEGHGRVVRADLARLDTRVSVFDASTLLEALAEGHDAGGERSPGQVLMHQIEFADVLVLSKLDLVEASQREAVAARITALLERLNPHAVQQCASFGAVAADAVLSTGRCVLDASVRAPGWLESARLVGTPQEVTATAVGAGGVSTFVYLARRPFHPERLHALLQRELAGVVRAKGWVWLANAMERVVLYSQSGRQRELSLLGRWWATRHPIYWPSAGAVREALDRRWQEPWGDRRQEIVWIGVDMDRDGLQKALDACLLSDAEMSAGVALWLQMPQPFAPFPWRAVVAGGAERVAPT